MINYCLGFVFNEQRTKVVLIEKKRPAWQKGLYNGIGGKIEHGETGDMAMVREFKEETGLLIRGGRWRYRASLTSKTFSVAVFTAVLDEHEHCYTMEDEEVVIVDIDKLKDYPVINNLHWLIPLCLDHGDYHVVETRDKEA